MSSPNASTAIRPLTDAEMTSVTGGLINVGTIAGMPSRDVGGCGTMWLLDRMISIFSGRFTRPL